MDETEQKIKKMKPRRDAPLPMQNEGRLLDMPKKARPKAPMARPEDSARLLSLSARPRWRPAEEAALRVIDWENTGGEWDPLGPGGGGWRA